MSLTLAHALRLRAPICIALTGAGGKTTALFKLAGELQPQVIVTAAAHLGTWQAAFADRHMIANGTSIEGLERGFQGSLLVTGEAEGQRMKPLRDDLLERLYQHCRIHSIPMLIEADGARQKPLKAWAEHEPPIPKFADVVVHVAGLTGMGQPLTDEHVHRAAIFSGLCGLEVGQAVTADALIHVLTHPAGGLKNIPKQAKRIVLLNQADTPGLQSAALAMTDSLLPVYQSVVIASLMNDEIHAVHEAIAGIVLAAGESSRFGRPKQVLEWKGQPFVRAVAQTALEAGLSPVVVVTGSNAEQVEAAVNGLEVVIARNEVWQSGQGSSIKVGVEALAAASLPAGAGCGGAIFLLADQPQVTTSIIRALKETHARGLHPIVAPLVMDRRANPVLFDRAAFPDLLTIEGDAGGRAVFHKHRVEYLPWHDSRLLLDVDTPEMYQRLIAEGAP